MGVSYSEPDVKIANAGMLAAVSALEDEGLLTKEQATIFIKSHTMTYVRPSWLMMTYSKLFDKNDSDSVIRFFCTKLHGLADKKDGELK